MVRHRAIDTARGHGPHAAYRASEDMLHTARAPDRVAEGAVRDERDGLERRISTLEQQARIVRNELAERQVARPPGWARELFGERPQQYRRAEYYDRAVRQVARYRLTHDIPDHTPDLGPEPTSGPDRSAWRAAQRISEQTQRRLGRDVARDHGRDLGHER